MTQESVYKELLQTNKIILGFLAIICFLAVGYVIAMTKSILLPFAFAIFVSYILYPVIEFFESKKIPSFFAILLTLILAILIVSGMVGLITESINSFSNEFPKYEPRIQQLADDAQSLMSIPEQEFVVDGETQETSIITKLLDNFSIPKFISSVVFSVSNLLSNMFMISVILLFMMMSRKQLNKKIELAFNESTASRFSEILVNINNQIQKYLVVKTLSSLLTATLVAIILSLFGVEFVIIWAILTFVLNFIPSIGSIIATVLPLIIVFIQFENPFMVLWIGLCIFFVQFVIGNIAEPKFMGKSINLSPLVILFSLIFWGWLWGIIGMFLSVPIIVIVKIIFENIEATKPLAVLMGGVK